MKKITLFGQRERPKKFDAETLINFYLTDLEEARAYLYANLGYFIDGTRFQGIFKEEKEENAGEIMLFIDGIFTKQIEKRGGLVITEKDRREIFKYIKISLWGKFMNEKIKREKDSVMLIMEDEDLAQFSGGLEDNTESLNELLAELIYNSDLNEDETKVCIAYVGGYSKNEIRKGWKYSQEMISKTIEKLKGLTQEFIKKRN